DYYCMIWHNKGALF
nr:immunoglobulin light chain junction region [Macaca mulatta]MOW36223.1 immunoglobulin light chain junction region [Macaca mulatta]MOW36264.1 immunoglobulin light chain junction region [Macaca mulatta]MOW36332.1 immunoglobulin light chain junction region [Macaca mulatta]MOW36561.1 immunoglobulin light chain junction region [Macaca mulatta]